MAEQAQQNKNIPSGNFRFIHLVSVVILLVVLGLTGWAYYQQSSLNSDIETAQQEIADAEATLAALQDSQVEALIVAQQTTDLVEASTVWSNVISDLLDITPLDVYYTSYSASRDDDMTLSVLSTSYGAAADLIGILYDEEQFADVFVSSLAQGSDQDEASVVSFGVTFNVQ